MGAGGELWEVSGARAGLDSNVLTAHEEFLYRCLTWNTRAPCQL